jgi:hypothetical protein
VAALCQCYKQYGKPVPVLRFPILALNRLTRGPLTPFAQRRSTLPSVALVARRYQILFAVWATRRECCNMVYYRTEFVQNRSSIPRPMYVIVSQRRLLSRVSHFQFQEPHHWSKNHWPLAPATEPTVTSENSHLPFLGEQKPLSTAGAAAVPTCFFLHISCLICFLPVVGLDHSPARSWDGTGCRRRGWRWRSVPFGRRKLLPGGLERVLEGLRRGRCGCRKRFLHLRLRMEIEVGAYGGG